MTDTGMVHEAAGPDVLDDVRSWFAGSGPSLAASGYQLELEESPPGRDKHSVSVIITSARRTAQLVVWVTGEAELSMADATTSDVIEEHREITSTIGLRDATETLVGWVGGAGLDLYGS
jgi:hypothetical protein